MLKHLKNILNDIDKIINSNEYNYDKSLINEITNKISLFIKYIEENKIIDTNDIKIVANKIYELNVENKFSYLTDHISNEFYAFEYLLIEVFRR